MGCGCWQEWLGAAGSCAAAPGSGANPREGEFPHHPPGGKSKRKIEQKTRGAQGGVAGHSHGACGVVQGALLLPGQLGQAPQSQLFLLPPQVLLLTGGLATGRGSGLSSLCCLLTGSHTQPSPSCHCRCQPGVCQLQGRQGTAARSFATDPKPGFRHRWRICLPCLQLQVGHSKAALTLQQAPPAQPLSLRGISTP